MKFLRFLPLSIALLLIPGCAIERFNKPPQWASVVTHHTRFFGLSAAYQGYGIKIGWGSDTFSVVPVSTNKIYAATVSDTFSLGQDVNPFSTSIKEDVQTGWESGNVPIPRLNFFKEPIKPAP